MMLLRRSLILLLLTTPLLPGDAYLGMPLWAWCSLGFTLAYAFTLMLSISREWPDE